MSESTSQPSSQTSSQPSSQSAADIYCELDTKLAKLESDHQHMLVKTRRLKDDMEVIRDQLHDAEVCVAYLLGVADTRLAYR